MNREMHGKPIAKIVFSGESSYQICEMRSSLGRELALSVTYHGDHEQIWVTESANGRELRRFNPRLIETIEWAE